MLFRKGRDIRDAGAQREAMGRHKKTATYKPRKEISEETNPAGTLILDFQLPEL